MRKRFLITFSMHAPNANGVRSQHPEVFEATSWLAIRAGMGNGPVLADPVLAEVPIADALRALHQRRNHYAAVVAAMPTHDAFLRHILRND